MLHEDELLDEEITNNPFVLAQEQQYEMPGWLTIPSMLLLLLGAVASTCIFIAIVQTYNTGKAQTSTSIGLWLLLLIGFVIVFVVAYLVGLGIGFLIGNTIRKILYTVGNVWLKSVQSITLTKIYQQCVLDSYVIYMSLTGGIALLMLNYYFCIYWFGSIKNFFTILQ